VEDIAERFAMIQREFRKVASLAPAGEGLREALEGRVGQALWLDVIPPGAAMPRRGAAVRAHPGVLPLASGSFSAILAPFVLSTENDLPGTLIQIRRALHPDGVFMATLLGPRTLEEWRRVLTQAEIEVTGAAANRLHPFIEVRDAGSLLQRAGFTLPVTDTDTVTLTYAEPARLLDDLRAWAATNVLIERRPIRRSVLARAMALYRERYGGPDGRVPATVDLVHVTGWAPHESQQKPLAPGSAKSRLADALGVDERPAGEKAGPR
jgi:SAM-dependent methyltransferase